MTLFAQATPTVSQQFLQNLQAQHANDLDKVVLTKTAFNILIALAIQNAK